MDKSGIQRDHGCIELKLLLRKILLQKIGRELVLDLYAGTGEIISNLYQGFERVYAVEKKKVKCRVLEQKSARAGKPKISVFCIDNIEFIKNVMPRLSGIDMIDMDAYGCPNAVITALFAHWKPEKITALAITDGARMNFLRGARIRLEGYCLNSRSQVTQGSAPSPDRIKAPRLSAEEYELLIRNFWKELGRQNDFAVSEPIFAWKKGKGVLYYGLWIGPTGP